METDLLQKDFATENSEPIPNLKSQSEALFGKIPINLSKELKASTGLLNN